MPDQPEIIDVTLDREDGYSACPAATIFASGPDVGTAAIVVAGAATLALNRLRHRSRAEHATDEPAVVGIQATAQTDSKIVAHPGS